MDKKRKIALVTVPLLLIMAISAGMNATVAKGPHTHQPKFTVQQSRQVMEQNSDEFLDTYLYVDNPSRDMETTWPTIPREVVHVVEVNHLNVGITLPNGTAFDQLLTPDNAFPYRWDTTVYPGEKSLVFFVGWQFPAEDGFEPGVYTFTYTLNVDFQGVNYDLTRSFKLIIQ